MQKRAAVEANTRKSKAIRLRQSAHLIRTAVIGGTSRPRFRGAHVGTMEDGGFHARPGKIGPGANKWAAIPAFLARKLL
jgi:hypothetical protein